MSQFSSPAPASRSQAQAGGGTIAILSQPRHDRDGGHLPAFISFHFAPSPVRASKPIQDEFPADDDDDDTLTISDKPVIPESVISLITRHQYQAGCVVGTRPVLSLLCCRSRPFFCRSRAHSCKLQRGINYSPIECIGIAIGIIMFHLSTLLTPIINCNPQSILGSGDNNPAL